MKRIAAFTVSAMLLMGQSGQPAARSVTAVRHWSLKDVTRVAIEVSGSFQFHSDHLHNPERVYYDLPNTHLRIDSKRYYNETVGDSLLQKIRVAENTPGMTRVVLDLAADVSATTTILTTPDRLVIELRAQAGNPLRTEPPPSDPSDRPVTMPTPPAAAVPPLVAPAVVPMAAKPKPPAVKPAVPVNPDASVPGLPLDSPKSSELSPKAAAASLAPADTHAVPDPGPDEVAKAARTTSAGTTSLVRALGLKLNRVVIDPGHGGHDQGTEGAHGLVEKEVVLDVALRVGKLVQDRMNAEVIYTRSDDTFIPLQGRTALANEKKADLFLSIHANSSPPYPRISGVETYYLNINGTKDAMEVAKFENGTTHDSIFDLQDIIKKIALHDKSEESHEFAKDVQAELYGFSLKNFPGMQNRGVKTAPFIVLIGANMPSVLAEIGFLSNAKEESLLKRPDYRQKLAEALYKGIEKYAESLSHFQAAVKP
jgi:N-acetylmuramoyl-L-alanine amidase